MKSVIRNFAPSWPSVVMGTGIVPIALTFCERFVPGIALVAIVFFWLSVVLFIAVFGLSMTRLLTAMPAIRDDLLHPVAGNFFSTLPIAAMVLAIDFMQIGTRVMHSHLAHAVALWLFVAGTAGIHMLGLLASAIMFDSKEVKLGHATFGWLIPPVSQLIIPVVGLDLSIHFASDPFTTTAASTLFIVSMVSLGIGMMLFMFVGPNVYHRYLYHEMPGAKMAPTVMIGLSPTAILTIILVKMVALAGATGSPWPNPGFVAAAKVIGIAAWGFSLWWFALAAILLIGHLKAATVNFALSWWALSFPVGALAVSTGALNKLLKLPALDAMTVALTVVLLVVWLFVAYGTIKIVANGSAFEKHE